MAKGSIREPSDLTKDLLARVVELEGAAVSPSPEEEDKDSYDAEGEISLLMADIAELQKQVLYLSSLPHAPAWNGSDPLKEGGFTDLMVTAANLKLPASSAPSTVTWRTYYKVLQFGTGDYGNFEGLQIPHSYDPGSDLYPHVHFINPTDIADGETIEWEFTLTVASVGHRYTTDHILTAVFTNDEETRATMPAESLSGTTILSDSQLIAGGITLPGDGLTLSAVAHGRIEYLSSSTYSDDPIFSSADFHARLNRFGSLNEYTD